MYLPSIFLLLSPFAGTIAENRTGQSLLLPLHVVLLELIIDPTCSIVLERQPAETDIMDRPPRDSNEKLLSARLLVKSVLQGLAIFAASFSTYFIMLDGQSANAALARTMGLAIIIIANLFLVQVNSSERDFAWQSMKRLIKDRVMWGVNSEASRVYFSSSTRR